ncbi:MAG: phage tail protein [Roseiflexaceae bacterium]|nr:phage tail protein [Roseiflexaceae bacterium]
MAESFLSEIRMCSFNFPPKNWALCNGQLLPINQNQALFSLLGTTYGGNGQTTFALPDLRGRVPIHVGNGHTLGEASGEQNHTLTQSGLPVHSHVLSASATAGNTNNPASGVLANVPGRIYGSASALTSLAPAGVANVGGSQPHTNMQPYLALNFIIALQGIYPSPN